MRTVLPAPLIPSSNRSPNRRALRFWRRDSSLRHYGCCAGGFGGGRPPPRVAARFRVRSARRQPDRGSFEVAAVRPTPEKKPQPAGCDEEHKGWRLGHGRHIDAAGAEVGG